MVFTTNAYISRASIKGLKLSLNVSYDFNYSHRDKKRTVCHCLYIPVNFKSLNLFIKITFPNLINALENKPDYRLLQKQYFCKYCNMQGVAIA